MKNTSILFIHRSVGQNLLDDGKLHEEVKKAADSSGIEVKFTDINNNLHQGVPGSDTKPSDYLEYFKGHEFTEDLVIIKSCYPNNAIKTDAMLSQLKQTYKALAEASVAKSPGKLLIMTTPPLRPIRTNKDQARRARELATWLARQQFDKRVLVFNLYDLLAQPEGSRNANTLRIKYRRAFPWDNHPNKAASLTVTPKLAKTAIDLVA